MKRLPMSQRARVEVLASNPAQYRAWAPGPPYWQGEKRTIPAEAQLDAYEYNKRKDEELSGTTA